MAKRIIFSGVYDDGLRKTMMQAIDALKGEFLSGVHFSSNCTHVVVSKIDSNEKILGACAAGKWILSTEYIIHSMTSGKWQDETAYEITPGQTSSIQCESSLQPKIYNLILKSARACRLACTKEKKSGLFEGWKVLWKIAPELKELSMFRKLLVAGQATVVDQVEEGIKYAIVVKDDASIADLRARGIRCLTAYAISAYILSAGDEKPFTCLPKFEVQGQKPAGPVQPPQIVVSDSPIAPSTQPSPDKPVTGSGKRAAQSPLQQQQSSEPMRKRGKSEDEVMICDKATTPVPPANRNLEKVKGKQLDTVRTSLFCTAAPRAAFPLTTSFVKSEARAFQMSSGVCGVVETHFGHRSTKIEAHSALDTLFSCLSAFQFPPNKLIHVVLMHILRNEGSPVDVVRAYRLLQDTVFLHPLQETTKAIPWLASKSDTIFEDVVPTADDPSAGFNFLLSIVSTALTKGAASSSSLAEAGAAAEEHHTAPSAAKHGARRQSTSKTAILNITTTPKKSVDHKQLAENARFVVRFLTSLFEDEGFRSLAKEGVGIGRLAVAKQVSDLLPVLLFACTERNADCVWLLHKVLSLIAAADPSQVTHPILTSLRGASREARKLFLESMLDDSLRVQVLDLLFRDSFKPSSKTSMVPSQGIAAHLDTYYFTLIPNKSAVHPSEACQEYLMYLSMLCQSASRLGRLGSISSLERLRQHARAVAGGPLTPQSERTLRLMQVCFVRAPVSTGASAAASAAQETIVID